MCQLGHYAIQIVCSLELESFINILRFIFYLYKNKYKKKEKKQSTLESGFLPVILRTQILTLKILLLLQKKNFTLYFH